MNFDFSDEQKLLQKTARDFLQEHSPLVVCRRVLESDDELYAEDLWSGAAEMGWQGAAIPEEFGGAGFGYLELVLIAEEMGRALAPIPFGSSVYLATEAILAAGGDEQKKRCLPELASGRWIGALALAERPGRPDPARIETRLEGGRLTGTKRAVPDAAAANRAVVLAAAPEGPALALVDLDGEGVSREVLASLDPSRPGATLRFDAAPAEPLADRVNTIADVFAAALLIGPTADGGRSLNLSIGSTATGEDRLSEELRQFASRNPAAALLPLLSLAAGDVAGSISLPRQADAMLHVELGHA